MTATAYPRPARPFRLPPRPDAPVEWRLPDADAILAAQDDCWRAPTLREFERRLFAWRRQYPDVTIEDADAAWRCWRRIWARGKAEDEKWRRDHAQAAQGDLFGGQEQ